MLKTQFCCILLNTKLYRKHEYWGLLDPPKQIVRQLGVCGGQAKQDWRQRLIGYTITCARSPALRREARGPERHAEGGGILQRGIHNLRTFQTICKSSRTVGGLRDNLLRSANESPSSTVTNFERNGTYGDLPKAIYIYIYVKRCCRFTGWFVRWFAACIYICRGPGAQNS